MKAGHPREEAKPGPGAEDPYEGLSFVRRHAAATLSASTGETWTPREVQATVWAWTQTLYELVDHGAPRAGA